jgi:hypothetical protein
VLVLTAVSDKISVADPENLRFCGLQYNTRRQFRRQIQVDYDNVAKEPTL